LVRKARGCVYVYVLCDVWCECVCGVVVEKCDPRWLSCACVAQLKVVYITRIRRSNYSIYLARYRYYCFSNKYTLHLLSYTVL
jgi:hypothetical protein